MKAPIKRHVVSYEKMSEAVAAAFAEKYPHGFSDYLPDITTYPKPDGTQFHAVTIELGDDIYLVKIQIKTDDIDDIEKWLDEESNAGSPTDAGAGDDEATPLPDDNISQYDDDTADA